MKNLNFWPKTLNATQPDIGACACVAPTGPRSKPSAILGAIALAIASPTSAQTIQKCVDSTGKVTFSDSDCNGQKTSLNLRSSIGDGGAAAARQSTEAAKAANTKDLALRRYREADDLVKKLRTELANNEPNRIAETTAILKEIERCRFHRISTRRCIEVEAMQQSDIDNKWSAEWWRVNRALTDAREEYSKAVRALTELKIPIPNN